MKLHRPAVSVYTVPTDAPEADGTLAWESTTIVITEVTAGDATGTGWTYGPQAVGDFLRETLAPLVEGRSALDIPATHEAMCRSVRNAGRPGIAACAISALDIALWDLKARLLELPLAHLLGTSANGSRSTAAAASRRTTTRIWPRSWAAGCTGSTSRG